MRKKLDENRVRVIKISKDALFEFVYEKFIEDQEHFLDVDALDVTDTFAINFERGEFIFCAYKAQDEDGKLLALPQEIDLQKLMQNMPDTTTTMFADGRYQEYTKEELKKLSNM